MFLQRRGEKTVLTVYIQQADPATEHILTFKHWYNSSIRTTKITFISKDIIHLCKITHAKLHMQYIWNKFKYKCKYLFLRLSVFLNNRRPNLWLSVNRHKHIARDGLVHHASRLYFSHFDFHLVARQIDPVHLG